MNGIRQLVATALEYGPREFLHEKRIALRLAQDRLGEEVQQIRRGLGGLHTNFREPGAELRGHRCRGIAFGDTATSPENVEDWLIRDRHAVGEAAPLEPRHASPGETLGEFIEQPRL